jgi:acyl-CoA synthetase (NDP forming)
MAAIQAAAHTNKPIAVLANMSTTIDRHQAARVRAAGVPVLEGTETGLRAIGHLLNRAHRLGWPSPGPRLTKPEPVDGIDPVSLLERYGIPTARTLEASDVAGVLDAAERIGYPVVVKTMASDHKTDVGGVRLGVVDRAQLEFAYVDLAARLGPEVTVSELIPPGVEIAVGMITDPQFGPVVIVAAGGTLIEVLVDRVALLAPVDVFRARKAIERLAVSRVLMGARGSAPADVEALAEMIARFSELAVDSAGLIGSIDLNPVIVGAEGAVAVDVLMKRL